MELTQSRTVQLLAVLLFLAAVLQPIYTVLYLHAPEANRQIIWSLEALIFVLMAAVAGSALVGAKRFTLGFSAIAFAAVLNVIQVGVGLTQFGAVGEAAKLNGDLAGIRSAVVGFSFFGYNAAKILLGLAAVVFGMGMIGEGKTGLGKIIGLAAVAVGAVAFATNACVMMLGIQGFMPRPIAGGSGVMAALLLALCLFRVGRDT